MRVIDLGWLIDPVKEKGEALDVVVSELYDLWVVIARRYGESEKLVEVDGAVNVMNVDLNDADPGHWGNHLLATALGEPAQLLCPAGL